LAKSSFSQFLPTPCLLMPTYHCFLHEKEANTASKLSIAFYGSVEQIQVIRLGTYLYDIFQPDGDSFEEDVGPPTAEQKLSLG
jgi:hypothetical protein